MASQSTELSSEDVQQGNILWLPTYFTILTSSRKREKATDQPLWSRTKYKDPEPGIYDHPILVISRAGETSIRFLILSSFDGKTLSERFSGAEGRLEWPNHLAVSPARHPLGLEGDTQYRPLRLDNGATMKRTGYLNISEVYTMDWRDAQPYWSKGSILNSGSRLDADSLALVVEKTAKLTGYKPKKQYDSCASAVANPAQRTNEPETNLAQ